MVLRELRKGFTLIEMLVVLGILGILMASLSSAYLYVQKMAWQAHAQELVSNAAVALTLYLQKEGSWPREILDSNGEFNEHVCRVLQEHNLMDITAYKRNGDNLKYDSNGKPELNPDSLDRFGLLDPWGRRILRRNVEMDAVSEEIRNHRLQFRIDTDLDGAVDSELGTIPLSATVRGAAIVWSCGPRGRDDSLLGGGDTKRFLKESRLSWSFGE